MTTTFNPKTTILVSLQDNCFLVEDLHTHLTAKLDFSKFRSNVAYKDSSSQFDRTFLNVFPHKSDILYSQIVAKKIEDILFFNQTDT